MNALRIGSICTGYAGLDAAVREVLGGELAWVADNDPGAAALLAHHFPDVPNLGDVTAVDWASVEPADVQAGGFPCQDISCAGARAGLKHGNRSGIWHEFVKAIAVQRPRLVVIENVSAILTARGDEPTVEHLAAEASRDAAGRLLRWLGNELDLAVRRGDVRRARGVRARAARVTKARKRAAARCVWHEQRLIRAIGTVLASLASLGYDAEWVVVTAAAAGACHRRARMFILAFPDEGRIIGGEPVAVISDGAWLEPLESLFGAAPFTGRVPASGRMAGGRIYAAEAGPTVAGAGLLPTPQVADSKHAEPTAYELAAKGDGHPYGDLLHTATARLLKTPTAQLAVNGGSQHPDKRRAGGHGPTLADQVEHELLPTPTARENGGRNARHDDTTRGDDLPEAVRYLPTPGASDWKGSGAAVGRSRDGKPRTAGDADLSEAVAMLLPTPAARDGKGRDMPGREGGKSLPETLLPTPRATDGTKGGPNQRGSSGDLMLPSAVMELLPTPTAADGDRVSLVYPRGNETLLGALLPTPQAADGRRGSEQEVGGRRPSGQKRSDALGTAATLLPTPTVSGSHGTDRRSDGTLLLPGVAQELALLPTPSVADGTGGHKTRSGDRKGEPLLGGIEMLLPTPRVSGGSDIMSPAPSTVSGKHGTDLGPAIGALLPTPSAGNFNDGESAESWQQRKDFHAGKETDATRAGMPLTVAAQLAAGTVDWGPYEAAIRRWEAVLGRPAPRPTVPGKTGQRLNPALPEWMQGLPAGWITDVPGLSRNAMLKLAGNGVVPQQGALAVRILLARAGITALGVAA